MTIRGKLRPELRALAPTGLRRMGSNPHANGGVLLKDLRLPDFRQYARAGCVARRGIGEATRVLGAFLRDVMKLNQEARNFRVFGPDETASNRLDALFEATSRELMARFSLATIISRTTAACSKC